MRAPPQATPIGDNPIYRNMLDVGGDYAFRLRGEDHAWTPESVSRLQHAVRGNNPAEYQLFAQQINEQNERLLTLRGLMAVQDRRVACRWTRSRPASRSSSASPPAR